MPRTLRAKLGSPRAWCSPRWWSPLGAAEARVAAPVVAKEREELIDRVNAETDHGRHARGGRRRSCARTSASGSARRSQKHGGDQGGLVALLSGATAVEGPGIKLVVDDAKDTDQGGGGPRESTGFADTGRVRDRDMQRVVNGLWQSGAEAVSINGQRLTALSAIRAAGDAILVDNRPLVPPYTVLAVGDGKKLADAFQDSADGQYLQALQESFDIRTSISAQEKVRLPAAPSLIVRTAEPQAADTGSGAADTGKGTS